MKKQTAIVLIFDGLGAKYLDPYGQSDFRHPAINRLAARSILYENVFANSLRTSELLESLLVGSQPKRGQEQGSSLGIDAQTHLITDHKDYESLYPGDQFNHVTFIDLPPCSAIAGSVEETQIAAFFAETIDQIQQVEADLVWVHCSLLARIWDAPIELRMAGLGEDDPEPQLIIEAPFEIVDWRNDPDQYLQWLVAYQAQLRVFDHCLDVLFSCQEPGLDSRAVLLTSTGGFAFGEHGFVGASTADKVMPFVEIAHLPLILHLPGQPLEAIRCNPLIQLDTVRAVLRDWLMMDSSNSSDRLVNLEDFYDHNSHHGCEEQKPIVITRATGDLKSTIAVRTNCWSFIKGDDSEHLFVRPDDLWEMNDVSDRCREVTGVFDQIASQILDGKEIEEWPDVIFHPAE